MIAKSSDDDVTPVVWNVPNPMTHLKYFHEVVRCGSIRSAADHLHVASSAISRQIKKLEEQIGVPLFERHPRGVVVTDAGEVFARYARDSLLSLDRVRSELNQVQGLQRGHVRLHTIEGLVADYLAPTVGEFTSRYPAVTFDLIITGTEQISAGLLNGDVDIGFAFNPAPNTGIAKAFSVQDPVRAVVAPTHALATRTSLTLAELSRHPLVIPEKRFGMRYLLDVACRDHEIELKPTLMTNSLEAMRTFARRGDGVALLHALSITQDLRNGTLVTVPVEAVALERGSVDACVLAGRPLQIAASNFADFAHARLLELTHAFKILR